MKDKAAFPIQQVGGVHPSAPGMTLRDWFAGQALTNPKICDADDWGSNAKYAYNSADAMLAERQKADAMRAELEKGDETS